MLTKEIEDAVRKYRVATAESKAANEAAEAAAKSSYEAHEKAAAASNDLARARTKLLELAADTITPTDVHGG